jgi:hypothetical protein
MPAADSELPDVPARPSLATLVARTAERDTTADRVRMQAFRDV